MWHVLGPLTEVRQTLNRERGSYTLLAVGSAASLGQDLRLCGVSFAVEVSGSGRFDREGACL